MRLRGKVKRINVFVGGNCIRRSQLRGQDASNFRALQSPVKSNILLKTEAVD
jgi:hypothetical protein